MSTCVAPAPPDWIDRWLHNDWGFCDSVAAALSLVPPASTDYDLCAFAVYHWCYRAGHAEAVDPRVAFGVYTDRPPAPEQLPSGFVSLGFDAVSNTGSASFECSPITCNYMAERLPVNRHGLLDTVVQAVGAASQFSVEEPEPGVYYVVEVLRPERP